MSETGLEKQADDFLSNATNTVMEGKDKYEASCLYSIAISLKRIADALEYANKKDDIKKEAFRAAMDNIIGGFK